MGCRRGLLIRRGGLPLLFLAGLWAFPAASQTLDVAASQAGVWELPDDVRAALAEVRDFSFDFDQPGFYAVFEHVKRSLRAPGSAQAPIEVEDWQDLLARPNDFRGRPVTITGVVGRNKAPYVLESRRELGPLWQLELSRADQPVACTLILTGSAADIPLNAELTVTGYFVMVRSYYGASKRVQHAALLVGAGPTIVARHVPRSAPAGEWDWRWPAGAIAAGLVVAVLLLRRSAAPRRHDYRTLQASREAPVNLAEDLDRWAGGGRSTDDP